MTCFRLWLCVTRSIIAMSVLFLTAGPAIQAAQEIRVLQAGAFSSNITPALGGLIIGGWAPIPATKIHDDLFAKCLVLDNGKTRLVFVVCDNLGLPREVCDAAKQIIHETTGIPMKNIMISATHTHSAVTARGKNRLVQDEALSEYQHFIVQRIADGVRCAVNNLEPAKIGWGGADEPASVFNRRWHLKPGTDIPNPFGGHDQVRMNPPSGSKDLLKPAGPTDPEIAFLSVLSTDGRPLALLANYSLHYVGGVEKGDVSADYFGMFADRIQQLIKADRQSPPFVAMMSNGTSGNINNIDFTKKSKSIPRYQKMREVAELTAQAVYTAYQNVEYKDWVELGARQEDLTLHVRKPDQDMLHYFQNVLAKSDDETPYHTHEKIYAQRVKQLDESPDQVDVPLQALRVGDVGISAIPFEVFVEIGLELKEKSPFKHSFTVSLANGSYGYLPTVPQHKLGGYETWMGTNIVEIEAAPKIVETLLDMQNALK
ncbi:MAG: neutral/alkaline non-lysosomal ceramidase N-terminal domain-containing protein [Candidatus Omnitrophica bacterium]|nr:neutral/alkaline non-lysosomal ceramidase N-terminal domain-containing protein [Candidatus Omnitrophota bacterium]